MTRIFLCSLYLPHLPQQSLVHSLSPPEPSSHVVDFPLPPAPPVLLGYPPPASRLSLWYHLFQRRHAV
ncbi:hypothetical protein EUTSA_v10022953mg [Eutrema salsugineum]|uniref:Uncharacterized protein n=1 Tax=Eutrema salsugineum TaxID=72664 RepID=V4NW15_EUTSA|nr:hypothetical protein EUTSA_v10022953mg [Eutrema salsugineum]